MSRLAAITEAGWAETGLRPRRSLRVFGMRRSGNHAIIDWILRNAGGSGSVFFNNCVPGRSPLQGFRTIAVNGARISTRNARTDLAGVCAPAGGSATVVVSYEDLAPTGDRKRAISGPLDAAFNGDLILYRSFLNWSASLLKKLQNNPVWTPVKRAAIFLGAIDTYRQMLALVRRADELRITPVCYDDWVAQEEYRLDRLQALSLPVCDNTLGEMQAYGGGSSFGSHDAETGTPDTAARFTQMRDDPELRRILAVSARDPGLMGEVAALFPHDAARLRETFGGAHA